MSADELALGVGVRLTIITVARGKRALQIHILPRENRICAQAITEAQAPFELLPLIHEM